MENKAKTLEPRSSLLACDHLKGPHTEPVNSLRSPVMSTKSNPGRTIIRDNTADMKEAFTVCFPKEQEDGAHGEDDLDDPEIWPELSVEDQRTVDASMATQQRLQCLGHFTLQLVVGERRERNRST